MDALDEEAPHRIERYGTAGEVGAERSTSMLYPVGDDGYCGIVVLLLGRCAIVDACMQDSGSAV